MVKLKMMNPDLLLMPRHDTIPFPVPDKYDYGLSNWCGVNKCRSVKVESKTSVLSDMNVNLSPRGFIIWFKNYIFPSNRLLSTSIREVKVLTCSANLKPICADLILMFTTKVTNLLLSLQIFLVKNCFFSLTCLFLKLC